jgi:hypothetical protein
MRLTGERLKVTRRVLLVLWHADRTQQRTKDGQRHEHE